MQQISNSSLILGFGNIGGVGSRPELFGKGENESQAFELLSFYLKRNGASIDTANSYGGGFSEIVIGNFLNQKPGLRPSLFISSKVGNDVHDGSGSGLSCRQILNQCQKSLDRLQTDYLDCYYFHRPDPDTLIDNSLSAIETLLKQNKILSFGLSNVDIHYLKKVHAKANFNIFYVQNECHLLNFSNQLEIMQYCFKHKIKYVAFGPLAGGLLTGKYQLDQSIPRNSRLDLSMDPYQKYYSKQTFLRINALVNLAHKLTISPVTLAVHFLLQSPYIQSVITGARTPSQLDDYLNAKKIKTSKNILNQINAIFLPYEAI